MFAIWFSVDIKSTITLNKAFIEAYNNLTSDASKALEKELCDPVSKLTGMRPEWIELKFFIHNKKPNHSLVSSEPGVKQDDNIDRSILAAQIKH